MTEPAQTRGVHVGNDTGCIRMKIEVFPGDLLMGPQSGRVYIDFAVDPREALNIGQALMDAGFEFVKAHVEKLVEVEQGRGLQ